MATLLQSDPTAIVSLKGRGVDRPRDLDSKVCVLVAFVMQPLRKQCSINLQRARSQQLPHRTCLDVYACCPERGGRRYGEQQTAAGLNIRAKVALRWQHLYSTKCIARLGMLHFRAVCDGFRAHGRRIGGMQLYVSYGARFEGRIVQQLIRSDGGIGLFRDSRLSMHDTWDTLLAVRSLSTNQKHVIS